MDWGSFWTTVFAGSVVLGLGGLGYLGRSMVTILTEIKVDLGKMGETITANAAKTEQWQTLHQTLNETEFSSISYQIKTHDETDQRRFEILDGNIERLDSRIDTARA